MIFRNLSDERRKFKPWLPASDKDVTEGRVVMRVFPRTYTGMLYPACVAHGAMNRLEVKSGLYRCSQCGVGCELIRETE